jgi:hypothetical protein
MSQAREIYGARWKLFRRVLRLAFHGRGRRWRYCVNGEDFERRTRRFWLADVPVFGVLGGGFYWAMVAWADVPTAGAIAGLICSLALMIWRERPLRPDPIDTMLDTLLDRVRSAPASSVGPNDSESFQPGRHSN